MYYSILLPSQGASLVSVIIGFLTLLKLMVHKTVLLNSLFQAVPSTPVRSLHPQGM